MLRRIMTLIVLAAVSSVFILACDSGGSEADGDVDLPGDGDMTEVVDDVDESPSEEVDVDLPGDGDMTEVVDDVEESPSEEVDEEDSASDELEQEPEPEFEPEIEPELEPEIEREPQLCSEGKKRCDENTIEVCLQGIWEVADTCDSSTPCREDAGVVRCVDACVSEPAPRAI